MVPRPQGAIIEHDDDPLNFKADNLKYSTQKQNVQSALRNGKWNYEGRKASRRLPKDVAVKLSRLLTVEEIAEVYGLNIDWVRRRVIE